MVHTVRLDNYTPIPRKLVLGTNSSFGTESIKIERGAGWDGLNLTATWHIPGREEPLRVALLDGDAMDVPPEVTKEAKDGVLVLAGLASGVQRASCNVEYFILEQAGVYGGTDAEPTPELAAQVLEAALQAKADAEAAAEDAAAAKANANKAQQAADKAAADAAKAGPHAEAARAAKEAAESARNGAIAAQQAAENAAAAAATSKSAADTLAAEAARAAQAAENSKAAANNAAGLAGENATEAQQAAATAIAAANDAGQIASDAAASKAAAEAAAKAALLARTAAAAAKAEAVKAQEAAQTAAKSAQDAQAATEKIRDEAKAAQKGAEAARDAAAKSAAAAKTSEDAAAKSAADADRTANSINGSMTQIAANKEAIGQLRDGKISKFYASSQGDTNLPDSDAGRIVDLKLYGKSEQKQYSGKNLYKVELGKTVSGVTFSDAGDGGIKIKGTSTADIQYETMTDQIADGEYICSTKITKADDAAYLYARLRNSVGAIEQLNHILSNTSTSTVVVTDVKKTCLTLLSGHTFDCTIYIQLEKGSTSTAYEPYVGGIPSPNPEYPQEIKSVVNPTVKVCGKNLFNKESPEKSGYIIGIDGTLIENKNFNVYIYKYIDKLYTISYKKGNDFDAFRYGIESNGIITRQTTHISPFTVKLNKGERLYLSPQADEHFICDVQIELGSAPTAYEPYHEHTATLPYTINAIPVTSGGNITIDGQQYIADYVDVERGKLVKKTKKYVFTGDEEVKKSRIPIEGFGSYYISGNALFDISEDSPKLCSHFVSERATSWNNLAQEFVQNPLGSGKASLGFRVKTERLEEDTVDGFKKFLKNNKIILIYGLNIPTETNLTQEEIQAFKALVSYYPATNVYTTSDQLDGYTVFNYPISLANGWNYVKQQIGDTRDYLYDIDLVTAEAYVNSAYATAIAEMEV